MIWPWGHMGLEALTSLVNNTPSEVDVRRKRQEMHETCPAISRCYRYDCIAIQRLIWFSLLPKLCIGYVHSWTDSVLVKPNFRCLHITLARQQLKWDLRLAFEIHYEALHAEDICCTAASTVIACIITMDYTDAGVSGHRHARSDSDVLSMT